jgi:hypothetical protein
MDTFFNKKAKILLALLKTLLLDLNQYKKHGKNIISEFFNPKNKKRNHDHENPETQNQPNNHEGIC